MNAAAKNRRTRPPALKVDRTVALVGMMGAGKTTVGRRLAARLALPFCDADAEIEKAAGMSVSDLFALHGEESFRRGEAQVIARLLAGPPHVLATGGGAVVDPGTRRLLKERAITVWIRADAETLARRAARRDTRPLLREGDPRAVIERLLAERAPYYAQADIAVDSQPGPHAATVALILDAIAEHLGVERTAS
ncbi:shikimate kinase [Amphiplicatus metriothermophilus]|uniref:Shikimate kinase n=1 Tax=Amphiplicatus metriothermophilus TaxID=1519374 RepID=A0A239PWG1_9PROT|nr:shikimate kinase [Amphiplicatus metriothermophilus]MBB5519720.1 shikimate kinase [Amphiplicatus metriothermophilus]SNT74282.1 shikimate kinase [Amphiplicatus metriothermophilus]